MRDFRGLQVWRKSHQLALAVYKATAPFPRQEMFGLTSQIRRAAASVPANIAEGCGRAGGADLARFLQMGMGSASELEYHVLLAHDLGFLADPAYVRLTKEVIEVKKMLTALIQKVSSDR